MPQTEEQKRAYRKAYYQRNREKALAYVRDRRSKHKELCLQQGRDSYHRIKHKHMDKWNAAQRERRKLKNDEVTKVYNEWYAKNKSRVRKNAKIAWLQRKNLVTQALIDRDGDVCQGCGFTFPFHGYTTDHVVPIADTGRSRERWKHRLDELPDLQLLCYYCQHVKGAKSQEYLKSFWSDMRAEGMLPSVEHPVPSGRIQQSNPC